MKERPILFSGPMVRALLNGSKSQTRRAVKPQPEVDKHGYLGGEWLSRPLGGLALPELQDIKIHCPYGQPGDGLWVRETWMECGLTRLGLMQAAFYAADGQTYCDTTASPPTVRKWKPSIHMPRWASRIALEVTGVRVERLQDISAADALAEGVNVHRDFHDKPATSLYSPVQAYRDLWEQINGAGSWDANPWVWVVEFRRLHQRPT